MREILFRGKLSHSNELVEGNLIISNNGQTYIIPSNIFEPDGHHLIIDSDNPFWVDENTVSQFTGLSDKNGVKIFEGDIVSFYDGDGWETGRIIVEFTNGAFNICCFHTEQKEFIDEPRILEVIGNIHDNPELL